MMWKSTPAGSRCTHATSSCSRGTTTTAQGPDETRGAVLSTTGQRSEAPYEVAGGALRRAASVAPTVA